MADGTRTHDDQNHNLGLYQLSYSHRRAGDYMRSQLAGAFSAAAFALSSIFTFSRVFSAS